jgi:hypothetical protein
LALRCDDDHGPAECQRVPTHRPRQQPGSLLPAMRNACTR